MQKVLHIRSLSFKRKESFDDVSLSSVTSSKPLTASFQRNVLNLLNTKFAITAPQNDWLTPSFFPVIKMLKL